MDLGSLDQRSNQPQQFLLLWTLTAPAKKGADVDIGNLAARSEIRFMSDEYARNRRIVGEIPTVTIRALVKLSGLNAHRIVPRIERQGQTRRLPASLGRRE